MPDLDLDRLESLARAATPGPWHVRERFYEDHEPVQVMAGQMEVCEVGYYGHKPAERLPDGRYIAAISPDVVLALVARLRHMDTAIRNAMSRIDVSRSARSAGDDGSAEHALDRARWDLAETLPPPTQTEPGRE